MKKLCIGLISMLSILAGTSAVAVADCSNEKVVVRITENNTLVVAAPTLSEARLYTAKGELINRATGKVARFELERGEFILTADTDCQTVTRKIVLK